MLPWDARILATMALCAGPILFLRSFRDLRLKRLIQNTPTARIRSMAMGLVEVNGLVSAKSAVAAPFSGNRCVMWSVEIAVARKNGGWTTVHRNTSGQPFLLEDETGVALVYPRGADSRLRWGKEELCLGVSLPDCYARYMSDQGLWGRHLWRFGAMRFRERVIEEGERIFVLGTAVPHGQAYVISEGEEQLATGTDGAPAKSTPARRPCAVIRKGPTEPAFLISQSTERDLVFEMGLSVLAKLAAGPVLMMIGMAWWIELLARSPIKG